MKPTAFDSDEILSEFLTDYVDGNLNRAERKSFEEYLARNRQERLFAQKVLKGKRALARLAASRTNRSQKVEA